MLINCQLWITYTQTHILPKASLLYIFQRGLFFLFDSWWLLLFPQLRSGLSSFEFSSSDQYEVLLLNKVWHFLDQDSRPAECACNVWVSWWSTYSTIPTESKLMQRALRNILMTENGTEKLHLPHNHKKRHITQQVTVSRFHHWYVPLTCSTDDSPIGPDMPIIPQTPQVRCTR